MFSNSLLVSAQELNKNDLPDPRASVDQTPVSVGDVPANMQAPSGGKTRITNAASLATDTSTAARAQQQLSKDAAQMLPQAVQPRVLPPNEFQKFIAENTGRNLPLFGMDFFANAPTTFAPVLNAPVPSEYLLGPGDEVLVRGWGTIDIDYRATIDRNGVITIPSIGAVVLSGVRAGEAESVIRGAVNRLYKGVNLNVNFGQLRSITVYVVGQANRPGTYTVSSLSTLVTALFASGGPNTNGSLRRVQVKRAGKTVAELDLYAFIAKGDKSADIKLIDGDTIYIPAAQGYVALTGKVNTPAVYELRNADENVGALLEYAGGMPVVADPRRAFLEHIDPKKSSPRTVEEFALDGAGLKKSVKNGDVLNVMSITPDFSNAVVLRGNVDQPVRAAFKPGMRVRDLIPSREFLITRASVLRQNSAANDPDALNGAGATGGAQAGTANGALAGTIGSALDEINWGYAVIERINRADLSVSILSFNLGNIFSDPAGPDNVTLEPGDTVTIFSSQDVLIPIEKRRVVVRVEGEVNVPGVYQMKPGENLHHLLARAGGPTSHAYLFGTAFYREQVRKDQMANLQKAATRLESQLRLEQGRTTANARSITADDAKLLEARRQSNLTAAQETVARIRQLKPSGRIAFGLEPQERSFNRLPQLTLENGDRLVVPSRPDFVHVFGAVSSEASPLWRPGMTVGKYLKMTGTTADADLENVFVLRVDGTIVSRDSGGWFSGGLNSIEIMPGDSIVVPEKLDKETAWSAFTMGVKEWTQIFANFGLGAAAIKVLK